MKLMINILFLMMPCLAFGLTDNQVTAFRNIAVRITPMETAEHGGTGSILTSNRDGSVILTNKHVCGVVKNGGAVRTNDGGVYKVIRFKEYPLHDLCLIKINENLNIKQEVAPGRPQPGQKSYVTGFPRLQPNIVTEGHFSDYVQIEVLMDVRECTDKEAEADPMTCAFMGFPVTETFNTQFVSNLIQPGNSGSAVLNSDGQLAGVIFAGGGDLSFGYIVPHLSVVHFLATQEGYSWQKPKKKDKKQKTVKEVAREKCMQTTEYPNNKVKRLCDTLKRDF